MQTYDKPYSWFCLMILVCVFISQQWSKQILGSMYGFGVAGYNEDSYYKIDKAVVGLNGETYGFITGPGQMPYAFLLLFAGQVTDNVNRKNLLFITCFTWSVVTFLNSFAETYQFLVVTKFLHSSLIAFSGPCIYSLLSDLFPKD